jgi:hypothetical protein
MLAPQITLMLCNKVVNIVLVLHWDRLFFYRFELFTTQHWCNLSRKLGKILFLHNLRHLFSFHHHWRNSPFWSTAFLKRLCQIASGFYLFGFRDFFFFYRAKSSALSPTPNLQDQVPVFMSPTDSVAQLYPQAPGSLFVAAYKSQGYRGDILTRLHTENGIYFSG